MRSRGKGSVADARIRSNRLGDYGDCVVTYINFLTEDEGAERIEAALGKGLKRLAEIKARWDPKNVFRTNRNVKPARVLAERSP